MLRAASATATGLLLFSPAPIGAQTHCDLHPQWSRENGGDAFDRHADSHVSLTDLVLDVATYEAA
jgi:hypothetical protein